MNFLERPAPPWLDIVVLEMSDESEERISGSVFEVHFRPAADLYCSKDGEEVCVCL